MELNCVDPQSKWDTAVSGSVYAVTVIYRSLGSRAAARQGQGGSREVNTEGETQRLVQPTIKLSPHSSADVSNKIDIELIKIRT